MYLRELDIGPFDALPLPGRFEVEGELAYSGAMPIWQVDLGETVTEAIERNRRAWIVAKRLGQVSRSSMHGCQHLGDIVFRRQLLLFFLEEGCQPPRMMLSVAKGVPKY